MATLGVRPPGTGGQRLEAVSREQFLRGVGIEEGKVLDVVDRDDHKALGRVLPKAVSRTRTCFLFSDGSELCIDRSRAKGTADLPRTLAHLWPEVDRRTTYDRDTGDLVDDILLRHP